LTYEEYRGKRISSRERNERENGMKKKKKVRIIVSAVLRYAAVEYISQNKTLNGTEAHKKHFCV